MKSHQFLTFQLANQSVKLFWSPFGGGRSAKFDRPDMYQIDIHNINIQNVQISLDFSVKSITYCSNVYCKLIDLYI